MCYLLRFVSPVLSKIIFSYTVVVKLNYYAYVITRQLLTNKEKKDTPDQQKVVTQKAFWGPTDPTCALIHCKELQLVDLLT